MKLLDTTNPRAHLGCQTVFSHSESARELKLAERFGIQLIGLYYAKVGSSWSSNGRAEGDHLHHIDLVCSGEREIVHDGKSTAVTPGQAWFLPGCTPVERRCSEPCRTLFHQIPLRMVAGRGSVARLDGASPAVSRRLGGFALSRVPADGRSGHETSPAVAGADYRWLAEALPNLEEIISAHVRTHSRFERVFELLASRLGADLRVCDLAAVMNLPLRPSRWPSAGTWG